MLWYHRDCPSPSAWAASVNPLVPHHALQSTRCVSRGAPSGPGNFGHTGKPRQRNSQVPGNVDPEALPLRLPGERSVEHRDVRSRAWPARSRLQRERSPTLHARPMSPRRRRFHTWKPVRPGRRLPGAAQGVRASGRALSPVRPADRQDPRRRPLDPLLPALPATYQSTITTELTGSFVRTRWDEGVAGRTPVAPRPREDSDMRCVVQCRHGS
jgi:hypothetical protein